jgi:hypothetical protein
MVTSAMTEREVLPEPRRFYGWEVNYLVPHPVEAEAIRRAAMDLLAGTTSLVEITNRWNADPDIETVFGGKWHPQVVERVLRRSSNCPLLLDMTTHARLLRRLNDPVNRLPPLEVRRQKALDRYLDAGYPLTSAAYCSVCNERVATNRSTSGGRRLIVYACRAHLRPNHPLRHDGRRHGSCDVGVLDAVVRDEMALLLRGGEDEYDALDLVTRRALVRERLRVLVHPAYTTPRFTIERRAS